MYYVWSFITSIIIFFAIQYNEYIKDIKNMKNFELYTANKLIIFISIYILLTILFYFMFPEKKNISEIKNNLTNIDPSMLRKISENIYTGFYPKE